MKFSIITIRSIFLIFLISSFSCPANSKQISSSEVNSSSTETQTWIVPTGLVDNDESKASENTQAINSALLQGNTLIPKGIYYISDAIRIPSFRKLHSKSGIIRAKNGFPANGKGDDTDALLMTIDSNPITSNIEISGLEVDGNSPNQRKFKLIYFKNISNSKIYNNILHGASQDTAIMVHKADGVSITGNRVYDNPVGDGINIYYGSQNVLIADNLCFGNYIGIESEGRNGNDHINFRNSGIIITNNITRLNLGHGILVCWNDNAIISNNSSTANSGYGINSLGNTKTIINSNNLALNGTNGNYPADLGITSEIFTDIESKNSDITVASNTIGSSLNIGVKIDNSKKVNISNNNIKSAINSINIGGTNIDLTIHSNVLFSSTPINGTLLIVSNINGLFVTDNIFNGPVNINSIGLRILGDSLCNYTNFRISGNYFNSFDYGLLFTDGTILSRGMITTNIFSGIRQKDIIGNPSIQNATFSNNLFDKGPDSTFPLN